MHPVYTKSNFGVHGVLVKFWNGSSLANGYITKQLGTNKYAVSDGTNVAVCTLAQSATQVNALGSSQPLICTMLVSPLASTATGGVFTLTYGLDASTSVVSGGTGWLTGDAAVVTGITRASGAVAIATNPNANDTLNINGTTVTFVASGAVSPQVNISGLPGSSVAADMTGTATALYAMLNASADANLSKCNYVRNGTTIVVYAGSTYTGSAGNSIVLTSQQPRVTVSGSGTLANGVNAIATSAPMMTVNATNGVVTSLSITAAGQWATLPASQNNAPPVSYGYFNGNGRAPVSLTLRFNVASIASSGGTGYAVGDALLFAGMTDALAPQAHISNSVGGAATSTAVDTVGSGITVAATSVSVAGVVEHVKSLYDTQLQTVEGHRYFWSLGSSFDGAAVVERYS